MSMPQEGAQVAPKSNVPQALVIVLRMVAWGAGLGAVGGAVYLILATIVDILMAASGPVGSGDIGLTIVLYVLVPVMGAFVGALIGVISGAISGALLAVLNNLAQSKGSSVSSYRALYILASAIVAALLALPLSRSTLNPDESQYMVNILYFVAGPTLVAALGAAYAAHRTLNWLIQRQAS